MISSVSSCSVRVGVECELVGWERWGSDWIDGSRVVIRILFQMYVEVGGLREGCSF